MLEAPLWIGKVVLVLVGLGFLLALALAWAFDITPGGIVRTGDADAPGATDARGAATPSVAGDTTASPAGAPLQPSTRGARGRRLLGTGLVFALAALAIYATMVRRGAGSREDQITSVAVLPFSDLSRDPENEYFSDGIADELLNQLTKVPGLSVAARTSSFYFKAKNLPIDEIARRLKVDAVMAGSVQRAEGRLRIEAQLISARTGYHLWSDRYDREARDLFAVEDEIARAVVSALRVQMTGTPVRRHVPDPAAYDLYLRGRFLLNRGSQADLERSIVLFEQAIGRDSAFAAPFAAAANAWMTLADAYVAPLQAYPKGEALARRALALDESNAEAHAALAYCQMVLRWDWAGAHREFQRALELNPKDALAHELYSQYLINRGDLRGAYAENQEAVRLEPFSAYYAHTLVMIWWLRGEPDSAIAAYERAQDISPGYVYDGSSVTRVYRTKGRYAEALVLDQSAATAAGVPGYGLVEDLVALGRRAEAEAALDQMLAESKRRYIGPESIALAALALGRREQALEWLERGVEGRSAWATYTALYPQIRPLRSDARYQRLLQRMGMDAVTL